MTTSRHINELLLNKDCVIIPGLGGFVANYKSSFLNPATHTFTPPARRIAFNASLNTNDGLLAHTIATHEGVSYTEALENVQRFVDEIQHRLATGEQVVLEKIGTLRFDAEKRIQFDPLQSENYLLDSFGLSPIHSPAIRREDGTNKLRTLKQDRPRSRRQLWRLAELIPAAAVLALLAFNPKVITTLNSTFAQIIPTETVHYTAAPVHTATAPVRTARPAPETTTVTPGEQPAETVTATETPSATRPAEVEPAAVIPEENVNTRASVAASAPASSAAHSSGSYHVIGGCFRLEENAIKRVNDAELAGFTARIIGKNEKGLYMVSIASSSDQAEISKTLTEVRSTFEAQAWVLSR